MRNSILVISLLLSLIVKLSGQAVGVPLNNKSYHIVDRLEIKTGVASPIHSGVKAYMRKDVAGYGMKITEASLPLTIKDRRDLFYLFRDNNEYFVKGEAASNEKSEVVTEKIYVDSSETFYTVESKTENIGGASLYYFENERPFLKHFYKTPANFFEVDSDKFSLKANFILNVKAFGASNDDPVFFNQRGGEIRGAIDNKVFFYTKLLESQVRFPDYVRNYISENRAVPGAGFYKNYDPLLFNYKDANDFLLAQGYIEFNISKHSFLQLGHGRNFIGNGYRSMFLSDFGNNYFYLKFNARVWKFHYQTILSELNTAGSRDDVGDLLIPKKYSAMHYLTYNVSPNFSLGIFEAVVFNRNNNFELQYLNPVIFYRVIEQALGSSDNALLGVDFKWNVLNRFQFYGQLMLDEFKFDELFIKRDGWWANKFGIQLGAKYIDMFGVDHLDGQVEYNMVRPYTFTHRDSSASYSHYNQALAHPLGANFQEAVFRLRYQAGKKWLIQPRLIIAQSGADGVGENWGGNILLPHTTRERNYDNSIGQGISVNTIIVGLDVSYELRHNLNLDLNCFYRNKNAELNSLDARTFYIGGGVRLNFEKRNLDF